MNDPWQEEHPAAAAPPALDWTYWLGQALTGLLLLGLLLSLYGAVPRKPLLREQIGLFVEARGLTYDHGAWALQALRLRLGYGSLNPEDLWDLAQQRAVVLTYRDLIRDIESRQSQLETLYGDPALSPEQRRAAIRPLEDELARLYVRRDQLAPLAEEVIQAQVSVVLAAEGLTLGGQPLPPVQYHASPLPWGLVVSPRDTIRMEAFVTLQADLPLAERVALEDAVAQAFGMSTLVVPVGGIGVYPTMVMETSDLVWQIEVVSHEWLHNYFDWHPLGWNYLSQPEMRTINETAASLAGKAIGRLVVARFYPELLPPPPPPATAQDASSDSDQAAAAPPAFDFQREMRRTREHVDALLAQGRIEEAEAYMEARRQVFWEHGYHIRKLNQAYFAFYGAYADSPEGGAAGEDPVGAAVRELWARSPDVGTFVRRIARVGSWDDLQRLLAQPEASSP